MTPFEQVAFESIPETPRKVHAFGRARSERVVIRSPHFGDIGLRTARFGHGPPLVCVHGLMTTSYSFRYLLEPLEDQFEVVMVDLPGAGESDKPDVSYGPREIADALALWMKEAGVWGAPVLGNSMGGYLAMWLAMRHPGAMSRLVNLHSPGAVTPRMRALAVALSLPGSSALLDWLVRRDPERWAFRNVHYYDESLKSREEAREYAAPLKTPEGRRAFRRHLSDALAASTMSEFAAELARVRAAFPVPILMVYARRDPMVPPAVGERLAAWVPSAELVWLEEGSHFAHVDAVDQFLAVALPFLKRAD